MSRNNNNNDDDDYDDDDDDDIIVDNITYNYMFDYNSFMSHAYICVRHRRGWSVPVGQAENVVNSNSNGNGSSGGSDSDSNSDGSSRSGNSGNGDRATSDNELQEKLERKALAIRMGHTISNLRDGI
ncbi:hypothetical protein V1477_013961, partial [Vespula maculifrons]